MATDPTPPDSDLLETATVKLPTETLDYLRTEANRRGISTGDMLRVAIGTQKFLSDAVKDGAKVKLYSSKGKFDVTI